MEVNEKFKLIFSFDIQNEKGESVLREITENSISCNINKATALAFENRHLIETIQLALHHCCSHVYITAPEVFQDSRKELWVQRINYPINLLLGAPLPQRFRSNIKVDNSIDSLYIPGVPIVEFPDNDS